MPSSTTRVVEDGDGDQAIVLLHGVGARADRWRTTVSTLAQRGFHAYAIDFPGHGFAEKGEGPNYSVSGYSRFVIEVMDALNLSHAGIVGTSLGAHVAARTACDASDRVDALALVGPTGLAPTGSANREALAHAITDTDRDGAARKLRALVHDPAIVTEAWITEEWRINTSPGADTALTRLADYFRRHLDADAVGDALKQLPQPPPTILIWGTEDKLVPFDLAPQSVALLPDGTELSPIADAGHAPYLERPDEFGELLLAFLERHRTGTH
ncbi:alpha/beta fold hydrolase [Rhodococcus rhodochrous]|uniref:alpha/beta fold hydrolase n=1 Tax=Rhodococcus rhodochrous TaxID=1829 RepID=UPI0017822981|nr:alpha/beta fold hydrolase [Rhodococcus rhodochrous]